MKAFPPALVAVAFALGVAACAHPQAHTQPERVPLDVPAPPERVIAPPPPEEPPVVAPQPQDAPSAKPARPRPSQPKPEPPPPVVTPPAPQQAPSPPAGTLQTTPPASQAETMKTIRALLARANLDLKGIAPASLNADGKAQFDTARRFADQAEQALKDMNLVFALTLADKAATLARSLAGRF